MEIKMKRSKVQPPKPSPKEKTPTFSKQAQEALSSLGKPPRRTVKR